MSLLRYWLTFSIVLLLNVSLVPGIMGQGIAPGERSESANAWMKKASNRPNGSHGAESVFHYDRDIFFDRSIGSPDPLTPETASHSHISSEGAVSGVHSEVPVDDKSAIVIGRFDAFEAFLSASRRSVYTEITISVEQAVRATTDKPISSGSVITVAIPGGTVDLGEGGVFSYLTDPREYSLQPNHKYLLLLSYESAGDFFTVRKSWAITNGIVRPNSGVEVERAAKGASRLAGLSVEAAVSELKRQLASHMTFFFL